MRAPFPSRALVLLLAIGLADLVATATLHARGLIVERNPLMAPLLGDGEMPFATAKGATLILAWAILARYERRLVRTTCLVGSAAYVALLTAGLFG